MMAKWNSMTNYNVIIARAEDGSRSDEPMESVEEAA
jgi:hypothetical protein